MVCSCCHDPHGNFRGCSCHGGTTHICRQLKPLTRRIRIHGVEYKSIVPRVPLTSNPLTLSIFNVDYKNRYTKIKKQPQFYAMLTTYIRKIQHLPSIMVFSEFQSVDCAEKFYASLMNRDDTSHYAQLVSRINYDTTSIIYDTTIWEQIDMYIKLDETTRMLTSECGHYLVIALQTKTVRPLRVLVFAVHMPHKQNKKQALHNLTDAVLDLQRLNDPCHVIIAGDFNWEYDRVIATAPLLSPFRSFFHEAPTTNSGNSIDNCLISPQFAVRFKQPIVDHKLQIFSHHPLKLQ